MTRTHTWLAPLVLGVVLIVVWMGAIAIGDVPAYFLPGPEAVTRRVVTDLTTAAVWPYIGLTVAQASLGAIAGTLVALPLAVVIHKSAVVSAAVTPFLGATQAIPAIALAPLLVLWIGYGMPAVIALCALMVFFPILIASVLGLRQVPRDIVEASRIDGASGMRLLLLIEAPLALPSVLAGLRNGFTLAVTGAVVGEMVMGGSGLGMLLTVQRDAVDTAGMFSSILILCLIASGAYTIIHTVERRVASSLN
jgi:NitT/TauT family transport system permease protein